MEYIFSAILVLILVSVNTSEINRFEPSTLNDPSHWKCLQFWSNGPLTHCQLIFETQSLFQIGLKLKLLDEIQVQIDIESGGKSEKISITTEKLHRNQYWSQDFDINEATSITFKIIKDGKLIDLKDVENLIEYIVIVGDLVNSKENSENSELELDEIGENFTDDPITTEEPTELPTEPTTIITSTSTSTVSTISTDISSSTTETSISTSTEETSSTTIITSTSTTEDPTPPELISDLDTELTENWSTTCKLYLDLQDLIDDLENNPEECPSLSLEDGDEQLIPPTESKGFWVPCEEKSCTIQYTDLDYEISNFGANLYVSGQGEIEITASGEQKFEKLQMKQDNDNDWAEYNDTAPPGSNQGLITFTLKVENPGDIVIVDKLQIYGHKALPPTPPDDDNNTLMIVMIVLGAIALVVILSGIAFFMWKKQIKTKGSFRTHSPDVTGERNDLEGFDNDLFGEDRDSLGRAGTFRNFDILNDAENMTSIPRVQLSNRERSRSSAFKDD